MTKPTTPTATLLLAQLQTEADSWDRVATDPDDQNSYLRNAARARRDQLDWVIAQVRTALPVIEEEAVEADRRNNDRLAAILESGSWDALADCAQ